MNNIPEKAVEAAALALATYMGEPDNADLYEDRAREALTAALPHLASAQPQPSKSDEGWSDEAIEAANDAYADKEGWATGPSIVGDIMEALLPFLAEARAAALDECEAIVEACATPGRFKVSDTWRNDMSPSEVYETGIIDIMNLIKEEFAALKSGPVAEESGE